MVHAALETAKRPPEAKVTDDVEREVELGDDVNLPAGEAAEPRQEQVGVRADDGLLGLDSARGEDRGEVAAQDGVLVRGGGEDEARREARGQAVPDGCLVNAGRRVWVGGCQTRRRGR